MVVTFLEKKFNVNGLVTSVPLSGDCFVAAPPFRQSYTLYVKTTHS